jgi:beta-N-acetylhexosaminidase
VLVLASVLAATALAAAGMLSGPRKLHPADVPARPALRPDPPAPRSAHSSLVGRLSVAQLAGQRIVYAYSGLTPPRSLLARIRAGEAAGVIFFGPNISSLAQIRSVIHELQAANASSPVHEPLLMLTDQEGGLVRRLPGAPLLSQRQIGESPNPVAGAAQAGAGAGAVLAGVGIDVNLAPVLDVYRRPGDFIDEFQRSYGMDPRMVARLGGAFISAQQRAGVAATAKHFPGLGAAEVGQDTDERPVTLDLSLHEIRAVDEAPYRTAMAAGVKLVMVSWAIYPALDPSLPAGLSARVIQGELRGRLGFGGVTITDGIGAGALRGFGTPAERGVLAAEAGADLLLCSAPDVDEDSPAEGISVLHGLAAAIAAGRVKRGSAERAVQRVLALRLGR